MEKNLQNFNKNSNFAKHKTLRGKLESVWNVFKKAHFENVERIIKVTFTNCLIVLTNELVAKRYLKF